MEDGMAMVYELRSIGVDTTMHGLSAQVIMTLKRGLLEKGIVIDGFRSPYRFLLPFLTLGSSRMYKIEGRRDDLDMGPLVVDVFTDVAKVISIMDSPTRDASSSN
jgi:hypothetical protein